MSSRYRSDPEMGDFEEPSACANILRYSWKTVTCLFSHITLVTMVVSYCVLGAFTFASLEVENEKEVKRGIHKIRENVTEYLWKFTHSLNVLSEEKFTTGASEYLKSFENALLDAMTKDGWDGIEEDTKVQWSITGSLFYSIIVITTIGYGHIAPKTPWGKVVTIFYAILGIPLMLLCLSNIGDIMATSFRFLYWRVCCYVCEKEPKKLRRSKSVRSTARSESRFSRAHSASFRRSVRTSTKSADGAYAKDNRISMRSADSGFATTHSDFTTSHSDTELSISRPPSYRQSYKSYDASASQRRYAAQNSTLPRSNNPSLDHRNHLHQEPKREQIEMDPIALANTPILCNRYVVGKNDGFCREIPGKGLTQRAKGMRPPRSSPSPPGRISRSLPRPTQNFLELPRLSSPEHSDDDFDVPRRSRARGRSPMRRSRSPNPSPKMMTPLGYGHKSKYLDDPDSDEDYEDVYYEDVGRPRIKHVPIWLCVFLVVGYILAGAYLFMSWEGWAYLDAAYFCFITLTTIGFGDFVPAKRVSEDDLHATISIAFCSLYLLFGISLLAMSFNLVQEEVISKVRRVAKTLGIIKSDSDDEDDED